MPNQRKKGKKRLNFWLTQAEAELLKDAAEELGLNKTDALRTILLQHAKEKGLIK